MIRLCCSMDVHVASRHIECCICFVGSFFSLSIKLYSPIKSFNCFDGSFFPLSMCAIKIYYIKWSFSHTGVGLSRVDVAAAMSISYKINTTRLADCLNLIHIKCASICNHNYQSNVILIQGDPIKMLQ